MKLIGEKIRFLRHKHSLTTRQLAEHIDTTNSQISRIENGLRQPSGDLIIKLADFFQVSLDNLMRDELEID